jgi:hypothetical protein
MGQLNDRPARNQRCLIKGKLLHRPGGLSRLARPQASLQEFGIFGKIVRMLVGQSLRELLPVGVCLFLSARLKGDVRHFVFFVHQEHGCIAFG